MYRRIADQQQLLRPAGAGRTGPADLDAAGRAADHRRPKWRPIEGNQGLRRALRFFKLSLRAEGAREWNWELRKFSERELLAAAEFARRNDILDRMVNTSERTRTMFDYTQRFPSPHHEILHPTTQELGLDKAWVYGLIRQESRFILDARSSVGASGLMQVMPATGDYVARKIGLGDYVKGKLTDLRTNIVLGANYMNMVLTGAGGSQPVATAAYNAGPGRAAALARHAGGADGRRDLRRIDPVHGNPHLRQERDVERHQLRGAVREQAAVAQGAPRHG